MQTLRKYEKYSYSLVGKRKLFMKNQVDKNKQGKKTYIILNWIAFIYNLCIMKIDDKLILCIHRTFINIDQISSHKV